MSILFPGLEVIEPIDMKIFIVCLVAGNIIFANFARHMPAWRRVAKFIFSIILFYAVGVIFGRLFFYGLIGVTLILLAIVHVWWLPKHGVDGITGKKLSRRKPVRKKRATRS